MPPGEGAPFGSRAAEKGVSAARAFAREHPETEGKWWAAISRLSSAGRSAPFFLAAVGARCVVMAGPPHMGQIPDNDPPSRRPIPITTAPAGGLICDDQRR